jgi:hypothetical protein
MKMTLLAASMLVAFQVHAQLSPQPTRAVPQRSTTSPAPATPASSVPLPLQVQRLAPQLVAFAGSQANFENLVNGLAAGSPVTLTTVDPSGATQTVTFTPAGQAVSSPVEIARSLEATRQRLIASGVATPNAQQLGTTLAGTSVPVTLQAPVAAPAPAAAGGSLPSAAEQIQARPSVPRVNTSDTPATGNLSDSPTPANPPAPGPATAPQALEGAPPAPAQPGIRLDR